MISSTFEWWMVLPAMIMAGTFMYIMMRQSEKTLLQNMREDGLTEEDIKDILGTQGYNKARGK